MLQPSLQSALLALEPAPQHDVFESAPWFLNLLAHGFAQPVQALGLTVGEPGQAPVCCLPLAVLPGTLPQGVAALSNYYSSLYGPVGTVAGLSGAAWRAAAQSLRRHPQAAVVQLQPLAADGVFLRGIKPGLEAAGYWVDTYFCFGNWYLPVAGRSFADYFATVPSALRNSVQRGQRRLAREGDWSLTIHTGADSALGEAKHAFALVYQQSWKQPEPCPGFMPGLIDTAAAQGWLRLGVLRLRGEPIAAQLWLVQGGKANIYKLAYVKGYEKLSAGSVLTAALMQHVLDVDRVSEVDYLTGDDPYKRDWMSHRRERVGLVAFDPLRPRGLLAALRHFGGRWVRRLLSVTGLTRPA